MLSRILLYRYNDQVFSFIRDLGTYRRLNFLPTVGSQLDERGIDPIFGLLEGQLSRLLHPVAFNNLLVILSFLLCLFFSYKLFFFVTRSKVTSLIFSIFNSTSLYFIYRVISATQNLYLVFVFPVGFYLLLKKKHPIVMSVFVLLLFGIASYYAYFLAIIVMLWYVGELIAKEISFRQLLGKALLFVTPLLLGFLVFFPSLFLSNSLILSPNYAESVSQDTIHRPIEDWYSFSFRPWYFLIPPESSVLFGKLSDSLFKRIEGTGYYLADDYTSAEMAGTYMGWHLLLGLAAFLYLKRPFSADQKKLLLVLVGILAISFPPSFTVGGHTVYTPSFLLYQVAPMFRVLVRWSVVIYLVILMLNSYLFAGAAIRKVFIFLAIHIVIFLAYLPLINIDNPPPEISFLKDISDKPAKLLIYPDSDFYSTFWILSHENAVLNPSIDADLADLSRGIIFGNSEYKPDYIVVYFDRLTDRGLIEAAMLNPNIVSKEDLDLFLRTRWGERIYWDSKVAIYSTYR